MSFLFDKMNINEQSTIQNDYFITKSRVETYLQEKSSNENIVEEIENTICAWSFSSNDDLEAIKADVDDLIEAVRQKFFASSDDSLIYKGINCVVHNFIWDNVMPLIRAHFNEADSDQHEKSKLLCNMSTRPEKMMHNFSSIPFTASVVELSMLDSFKSPIEKLSCLCTTYDFLFAEAKSALVTLISEYSDREFEIPMINNEQVGPILLDVFIKSKLLHPYSNLFYMKLFGETIIERDHHIRSTFRSFEHVINAVHDMTKNYCGDEHNHMKRDLLDMNDIDVCKIMEISANGDDRPESHENATLNDERRRRLVSLVILSTSENDYVPTNISKIFMD